MAPSISDLGGVSTIATEKLPNRCIAATPFVFCYVIRCIPSTWGVDRDANAAVFEVFFGRGTRTRHVRNLGNIWCTPTYESSMRLFCFCFSVVVHTETAISARSRQCRCIGQGIMMAEIGRHDTVFCRFYYGICYQYHYESFYATGKSPIVLGRPSDDEGIF